jgi:hypothetical protein
MRRPSITLTLLVGTTNLKHSDLLVVAPNFKHSDLQVVTTNVKFPGFYIRWEK